MKYNTKEEAAEWVMMVCRNRLALLSPTRQEAEDLIREHNLTASDLLLAAVRLTYKAS